MKWNAIPLVGVNDLRFGMNPEEVCHVLGVPNRVLPNVRAGKYPTLLYEDMFIYFSDEGICDGVEFFEGEVYVDGILVFPTDMEELRKVAPDMKYDEVGCLSVQKSIGIYAPLDDVEGILFAVKDYYQKYT